MDTDSKSHAANFQSDFLQRHTSKRIQPLSLKSPLQPNFPFKLNWFRPVTWLFLHKGLSQLCPKEQVCLCFPPFRSDSYPGNPPVNLRGLRVWPRNHPILVKIRVRTHKAGHCEQANPESWKLNSDCLSRHVKKLTFETFYLAMQPKKMIICWLIIHFIIKKLCSNQVLII